MQEVAKPTLSQTEAVPGSDVKIPDAHIPCRFKRGLRLLVGDLVELVSERNAAHPEAEFRLEDTFGTSGLCH